MITRIDRRERRRRRTARHCHRSEDRLHVLRRREGLALGFACGVPPGRGACRADSRVRLAHRASRLQRRTSEPRGRDGPVAVPAESVHCAERGGESAGVPHQFDALASASRRSHHVSERPTCYDVNRLSTSRQTSACARVPRLDNCSMTVAPLAGNTNTHTRGRILTISLRETLPAYAQWLSLVWIDANTPIVGAYANHDCGTPKGGPPRVVVISDWLPPPTHAPSCHIRQVSCHTRGLGRPDISDP